MATNQANARAAYAAATTQYMLDTATTALTEDKDYTYDTSKGQIVTTGAATGNITGTDISAWKETTDSLGDKTYKTWTVTLDKDGVVKAYKAS